MTDAELRRLIEELHRQPIVGSGPCLTAILHELHARAPIRTPLDPPPNRRDTLDAARRLLRELPLVDADEEFPSLARDIRTLLLFVESTLRNG